MQQLCKSILRAHLLRVHLGKVRFVGFFFGDYLSFHSFGRRV